MNPEEKVLLERAVELSRENNKILHKMQRAAKWAAVWGFVKFLIVVIPVVIGILYLSPYAQELWNSFQDIRSVLSR
ncbi:MAG: hypothetical protein WDZ61_00305 [Parcubacteria group bacterium]